MSAQPPTPWAQPSAPARWRWHVRMWGGPRGTGHAPGTGDRLLGAGSGRRDTLGHCCWPGGTAPGLGTHRGRALGLCSPPGAFEGATLLLHRRLPVGPSLPCLSPGRAPWAAGHPGDRPEVQEHGAGALEARREQSPLHLHAGAPAGGYVASKRVATRCLGTPPGWATSLALAWMGAGGLGKCPGGGQEAAPCLTSSLSLTVPPRRQGSTSGSWSAPASPTATST